MISDREIRLMMSWRDDWCKFARDVLGSRLDSEQQAILHAFQHEHMVAVSSGTARGKDYVAAVCALCFLYLTPRFDKNGELVSNTKVFMTAPTGRQVDEIMMPEISRLYRKAAFLPGRELSTSIRTAYKEWFLTGFKADDSNMEAWSGLHANNIAFIVTEASGMSETVFNAIEGNLQGNSRLLIVFNPNVSTGYAARAMKSDRFKKFRLNSLHAENVVSKKNVIPGQVDFRWVDDHVRSWCMQIRKEELDEGEGDFYWEGKYWRPNDLARVKILGLFPKVGKDVLIPQEWIELANERWIELSKEGYDPHFKRPANIGVDVAGMGRDNSVICPRFGNYVSKFDVYDSGGEADHMHIVGLVKDYKSKGLYLKNKVFIDTIGEGAGVYSRLNELHEKNIYSAKNSYSARGLHDITGEYEFANMRAYLHWAVRDWLNPKNGYNPAIPPDGMFLEEASEIHWKFQSDGRIIIESKDDIKERIGRSPDKFDSLSLTFWPREQLAPMTAPDWTWQKCHIFVPGPMDAPASTKLLSCTK